MGRMRRVADVRRGRPELEEPGIAEAEKLAGASAGLAARGGVTPGMRVEQAVTPMDQITQHRDQLQDAADQYARGKASLTDFNDLVERLGWKPAKKKKNGQLQATDPDGNVHTFGGEE